jgi:hypothetical protein
MAYIITVIHLFFGDESILFMSDKRCMDLSFFYPRVDLG